MIFYNNVLLELEKMIHTFIFSTLMFVLPHPIKQIQNLLIQDRSFILAPK
jgi:hypothetical protein